MDAAWSNFLFQNTPTQNQVEGSLQSELMSVHGSSQSPPPEHMSQPPSTVDTAALSEDPPPVKAPSRPARASHVCSICNKQFKNNYNLRRHQSVHTGVRMTHRPKETVARPQAVPLSLLHLSMAPPLAPQQAPGVEAGVAVTAATAVVASANPPHTLTPAGAVAMGTGATGQLPVSGPRPSAFRDVYHLNRHRLSHSDEKPYSCPICQQRFKRKDRMSHHVRSHQGGVEKPYICPHCAKAFSRPDHLNSHVRQVHSSERPFKCPTCESSFATKDRLRAHMIRHEEKVPCHICGKLLSAAYITDHMRVHNQSQHHSCHLCNRSFTTLTYLRVHAQKHHGQEWKEGSGGLGSPVPGGVLVCQLCGIQCKTPTQLQGHMGTHSSPQGHMGTHSSPQGASSPDPSSGTAASGSSLANMAAAPVYVSGAVVDLLVTDCSSIAATQAHS
ncbi:hypothetical protein NHX12_025531 [Muraenolepis orangiensis]|uniref:C2H2-type domain-containing protein n=1 Tax=Muraenolepis orangiensis TaxID=630683 RepID=A0A9Q0IRN4_9TELE|nr:hypothetical protein NHX12_025531 [Muraenolepis orangiensis]